MIKRIFIQELMQVLPMEILNFSGIFSKVNTIPTYTDLYYMSPSEQGNANLVAEEALTGEFGYIFKTNKTLLKASAFWRKSDNAIDWQKANANFTLDCTKHWKN